VLEAPAHTDCEYITQGVTVFAAGAVQASFHISQPFEIIDRITQADNTIQQLVLSSIGRPSTGRVNALFTHIQQLLTAVRGEFLIIT
jgi:calcineurin-like phosphoesterase